MLENFDFSIINTKDFKEDSVREEIIVPLLKELGYTADGTHKIIRSKNLIHPFVHIGTTTKKITLIPDYILAPNSKYYCILDAKSPTENIYSRSNIEQAYSYAIHHEIQSKYFALCNGIQFALYSVKNYKPILEFKITEINKHLGKLRRLLSPDFLGDEELLTFNLDYGLYFLILGMTPKTILINFIVPDLIAKLSDTKYSLTAAVEMNGRGFCISYDFNKQQYEKLLPLFPLKIRNEIENSLKVQPFYIDFKEKLHLIPEIMVHARLGNIVHQNPNEDYLPLIVEEFESLNNQDNK